MDGNWHTIEEVTSTFKIDRRKADDIIGFFVKCGFLRIDDSYRMAIIEAEVQRILKSIGVRAKRDGESRDGWNDECARCCPG